MDHIFKVKQHHEIDHEKQQSCLRRMTSSPFAVPSDIYSHISKYHSLLVFSDIIYWLPPLKDCWFSTSHQTQAHLFFLPLKSKVARSVFSLYAIIKYKVMSESTQNMELKEGFHRGMNIFEIYASSFPQSALCLDVFKTP